jgi:hypothetical protein
VELPEAVKLVVVAQAALLLKITTSIATTLRHLMKGELSGQQNSVCAVR